MFETNLCFYVSIVPLSEYWSSLISTAVENRVTISIYSLINVYIYILINIGNARQFLEHQVYEHMRCSIPDSGFYSFPDKENSKFWNRENSKAPRYEWRIRINLRNDRFQNREHVGSQASFLSRRRHELCSRISYTTSLSRLHAKFKKLDLLRNSCLALEEYQRKIFLKSTEKSIHPSISKRLTTIQILCFAKQICDSRLCEFV